MKIVSYFFAAMIAGMSFSALAAQQINEDQTSGHQLIGDVSISGVRGSTDDAVRALAAKADKDNGSYFHIIELDSPGNSSDWMGNAQVYR